ncbi:MAG: hypothetical protein D6737_04250 [Chloroflexi bacterium]|nr:MAG: hypothetical protein D6737_04250 [Chloroflexota bacterium]
MRILWRVMLLMWLLFGGAQFTIAQTGGQYCVRAFEDRDGNGERDASEPFLTEGVGATLLDSENVVIASALMDGSPSAAQGVICFQFLPAGEYTMILTSPEHNATTATTFTMMVEESGTPTLVLYGAQRIPETLTTATSPDTNQSLLDRLDLSDDERDLVERLIFSTLGAIIVVMGMIFLGILIYWVVLRNRYEAIRDPRRTTGSYPVVPRDTGAYPAIDPRDSNEWPGT